MAHFERHGNKKALLHTFSILVFLARIHEHMSTTIVPNADPNESPRTTTMPSMPIRRVALAAGDIGYLLGEPFRIGLV